MSKKIVIAGAGISGLSMARMLNAAHEVVVLEKKDRAGGLVKCERVDGNLFHLVGGHVFNSKENAVLEWFWQHFDRDKEFVSAKRKAAVWLNGQRVGYPIEDHLYQLPPAMAKAAITELLALHGNERPVYANFGDFLAGNFGRTLYEVYFKPYNTKLWNTDLSAVPLEWLDGKLPMPDTREIVLHNILRKEESELVHATFYYPVRDGSQFIVDRLAEGIDINVSSELVTVAATASGRLLLNGERDADYLVYCGDVRRLKDIVHIDDPELRRALHDVADLRSNGTSNVLCTTDDTDLSWLYIPEAEFQAHRIIYTGNFSDTNSKAGDRRTCTVEFSGQVAQGEILAELTRLPGNLEPLRFNYELDSYVIQNASTRARVRTLKNLLARYNIYLLGRFAEWEYHNMDKCIAAAMKLKQELGL